MSLFIIIKTAKKRLLEKSKSLFSKLLIISEIKKKNKKCVGASLPYSLNLFIL